MQAKINFCPLCKTPTPEDVKNGTVETQSGGAWHCLGCKQTIKAYIKKGPKLLARHDGSDLRVTYCPVCASRNKINIKANTMQKHGGEWTCSKCKTDVAAYIYPEEISVSQLQEEKAKQSTPAPLFIALGITIVLILSWLIFG